MDKKIKMSSPKEEQKYVIHDVEHFQQRYNWDCGLSCVLMLLPQEQREHFLKDFSHICTEEGFGQSTWTIDLCYLLKRFGIKHHMYTKMLGVNESYRKQSYYNRIIDLQASANQILVTEEAVSTEKMIGHLRDHGPIILLVDAGLLVCDLCKHNKLKAEFRRCFGGGYKGHYILVVGCWWAAGRSRRQLLYRDPARAGRLCAARLQRARAAAGTDYDALFVYTKHYH